MNFRFTPKRGQPSPSAEEDTFTIDRLWKQDRGETIDVTHLVDRSYEYCSARELRWHLADRFELAPQNVRLDRI